MYRIIAKRLVARQAIPALAIRYTTPQILTPFRGFQSTAYTLAKGNKKAKGGKKGKKGSNEEVDEVEEAIDNEPLVDFDDVNRKFTNIVERFTKYANEAKLGKTNPGIFDKLNVETSNGMVSFTSIAQTTVKGRNFIITVFDPSHVKDIINAVLGSNLNMNPQIDPNNKLSLKVPLPPLTTERKKENVKELKAAFEKFKNGTGKPNSSLGAVRSDVKNKMQKHTKKKLSDAEAKIANDFEKIHKQYVEKLTEIFKSAEQAILK